MEIMDAIEKRAGVRFKNGLPQFEGPRKQVWDAFLTAGEEWLTIAEIAGRAGVDRKHVRSVCNSLVRFQLGGVRDDLKYVLVSREVPGRIWRFRTSGTSCQLRVVPNTINSPSWRSAGGLPVREPFTLSIPRPVWPVLGEATP